MQTDTVAPASDRFIEGKRVTIAMIAYLVEAYPGRTSAELAVLAEKDRPTMARRVTEAERSDNHAVYRGKTRQCSVTGHTALAWWANPVAK